VDLDLDHQVFNLFTRVRAIPQIPNIGFWVRTQRTSARGRDSAEPHVRAIGG
jgi:hypothetical protein